MDKEIDQEENYRIRGEEDHSCIMFSSHCISCIKRASYIYKGNSLCEECFKKEKDVSSLPQMDVEGKVKISQESIDAIIKALKGV